MDKWKQIPTDETLAKTVATLKENGIDAIVVENGVEAKEYVERTIPEGATVMSMTSVTLEKTGIEKAINESGKYDGVRAKLYQMDRATQGQEMQAMGSSAPWSIGSVHAVTTDGKVIVASQSGSQLSGYAYGSSRVLWIVGAQKIVKDLSAGMKRLEEYVLPLESDRAHKAYGVPGSSINKLLIVNKEAPGRITLVLVKEVLGF